ncbi:aminomethyltransferase family protein [Halolamina salifodinae]|uniref:Aminomethyltransferase n=1 Tax=Halolamina salifodinae TaxID=1202767 RepID=A0A8T4GX09_9EURY|nr:aminomethyltransferase family protein [Halolamina salifodinae]MBP1985828.1 aminomethyltransferase [Halolamina salifodinae]
MTLVGGSHDDHGATFGQRGGREIVEEYGRADRAVRAVRNAVGVIEMGYGVVVVTGSDRHAAVDAAITNDVPEGDGAGCYALVLDDEGTAAAELFVYAAGERLLLFSPPGRAPTVINRLETGERSATAREATEGFGVFGVHGPMATEKIASVLHKAGAPTGAYSFVRGSMGDAGVSVVAGDAPGGEESYEVICAAEDADEVWMTLLSRGNGAAPFGYRTYETLTLEAGTPLFDTEIDGKRPATVGLSGAAGLPAAETDQRLVGVRIDAEEPPAGGTTVLDDDGPVGRVTRARWSPSLSATIGFAIVDADATVEGVRAADDRFGAEIESLPFVEGSDQSRRLPSY